MGLVAVVATQLWHHLFIDHSLADLPSDPEKLAAAEGAMLELTAAVPTRVLWGLRDPYIPARYAERFGAASVRTFDDCGHWLPAEAPSEVAERLRGFL